MAQQHMYEGWSYERFRQQRNRAHFLLEDPHRFVTVLLLRDDTLVAIDSPCYHACGPLGEGELLDVEDVHTASTIACLQCPWHKYLIAVDTGELLDVRHSSSLSPAPSIAVHGDHSLAVHGSIRANKTRVSRGAVVQRTHKVWLDESTGILTIEVEDNAVMRRRPLPSDRAACDLRNGALTMQIFDIKSKGLDV